MATTKFFDDKNNIAPKKSNESISSAFGLFGKPSPSEPYNDLITSKDVKELLATTTQKIYALTTSTENISHAALLR